MPWRPIDLSEADVWAVDTVINEGIQMNLSETEMLLATQKLRDRGCSKQQVADRLHVSLRKSEALLRRVERLIARVS